MLKFSFITFKQISRPIVEYQTDSCCYWDKPRWFVKVKYSRCTGNVVFIAMDSQSPHITILSIGGKLSEKGEEFSPLVSCNVIRGFSLTIAMKTTFFLQWSASRVGNLPKQPCAKRIFRKNMLLLTSNNRNHNEITILAGYNSVF